MSTTVSSVELTTDRRRRLAAVLLRGDLRSYDSVAAYAQVINDLIDELLCAMTREPEDTSWDVAADRLIGQYAYRVTHRYLRCSAG